MKFLKIFFALFFIPLFVFGWGNKGHKLITKHALNLLPTEINFSAALKDSIIKHSVDPDYRKKQDPSEPQKHFIDIDYYKEFLEGRMITSLDSLIKIYGEDDVIKQGVLPWATQNTYANVVNALKEMNQEKIILYVSDLAHYVADGHQPLHATLNYNGQLSGQKGIHFRYEIEMVDRYLKNLENNLETGKPGYVENKLDFIFNYIYEANFYMDNILAADKLAVSLTNGEYDDLYYRVLWFRTEFVTITEINEGSLALASLIYSAWIDAGKPEINI